MEGLCFIIGGILAQGTGHLGKCFWYREAGGRLLHYRFRGYSKLGWGNALALMDGIRLLVCFAVTAVGEDLLLVSVSLAQGDV